MQVMMMMMMMDKDALMRAASDIDIDMCIRLWQRPEWLFGRCARHSEARQGKARHSRPNPGR
jgi:hypothetical protein